MVIITHPDGIGHDEVGLGGIVGVVGSGLGDGVWVGSPGSGVGMSTVGVVVLVDAGAGANVRDNPSSAKEMAKLPPMMMIETRAASSPEISSRRGFIGKYPSPHQQSYCLWQVESAS